MILTWGHLLDGHSKRTHCQKPFLVSAHPSPWLDSQVVSLFCRYFFFHQSVLVTKMMYLQCLFEARDIQKLIPMSDIFSFKSKRVPNSNFSPTVFLSGPLYLSENITLGLFQKVWFISPSCWRPSVRVDKKFLRSLHHKGGLHAHGLKES